MKPKYVEERTLTQNKKVYVFHPPNTWKQAVDARSMRFEHRYEADAHSIGIQELYSDYCRNRDGRNYTDKQTVGGLISYYRTTRHYKDLAHNSKESYDYHWNQLFKAPPLKGCRVNIMEMKTAAITPEVADSLHDYFLNAVSRHKANSIVSRLRRVWNVGFRAGHVKANPFSSMGIASTPHRQVRWSPEDVETAINTADSLGKHSLGTAITLMYHLCHSPVDIRKLKWGDLDNGGAKFIRQKTGAVMDIPLPPPVLDRLAKVKPDLPLEELKTGEIILCEATSRPYSRNLMQRWWRSIREEAKLDSGLWLSDLRRTGATEMADSGCTASELRSFTGHKTLDVLSIYARPTNRQATNALNKRYATL